MEYKEDEYVYIVWPKGREGKFHIAAGRTYEEALELCYYPKDKVTIEKVKIPIWPPKFNPTPELAKVLEDIDYLREAYSILLKIYTDIGPYNNKPISEETQMQLNNFFEFDDSE